MGETGDVLTKSERKRNRRASQERIDEMEKRQLKEELNAGGKSGDVPQLGKSGDWSETESEDSELERARQEFTRPSAAGGGGLRTIRSGSPRSSEEGGSIRSSSPVGSIQSSNASSRSQSPSPSTENEGEKDDDNYRSDDDGSRASSDDGESLATDDGESLSPDDESLCSSQDGNSGDELEESGTDAKAVKWESKSSNKLNEFINNEIKPGREGLRKVEDPDTPEKRKAKRDAIVEAENKKPKGKLGLTDDLLQNVRAGLRPSTSMDDDDLQNEELANESNAKTSDDEANLSPKERAASRWNKAAVKVVTTNVVSKAKAAAKEDKNASSRISSSDGSVDLAFEDPVKRATMEIAEAEAADITKALKKKGTSKDTSQSNSLRDPLEGIPTDRTPIKKLMKKLNDDDESLTVLKLDGRKKIKEDDWESLFTSLEDNATLTHLSMSRCELKDETVVPLVLALVENETLVALCLSNNKSLTDDTAKGFLKVLTQSNKTLKILDMERTKVTKSSTKKLNELLEDRDEEKKSAKLQEERQRKIKELLSFSAGDVVAKEKKEDDDAKEEAALDASRRSSCNLSVGSGTSSNKGSSKASSKKRSKGKHGPPQTRSGGRGLGGSGRGNRGGPRASMRRGSGTLGKNSMRASMTAQQMAQLGGSLQNLGADAGKFKEQRKARGECETCGQKCFQKTMFKTTPLTIPECRVRGYGV